MADTLFPTRHGSLGFARTVGRLVLLNWAKGTFLLINWAKTAPDSNRIRETLCSTEQNRSDSGVHRDVCHRTGSKEASKLVDAGGRNEQDGLTHIPNSLALDESWISVHLPIDLDYDTENKSPHACTHGRVLAIDVPRNKEAGQCRMPRPARP